MESTMKKAKPIYWIRVLYLEDGVERDVDALTPCLHVRDWTSSTNTRIDHHHFCDGAAWRMNEIAEGQHVYIPTQQVGTRDDRATWLLAKVVRRPPESENAMGPRCKIKVHE